MSATAGSHVTAEDPRALAGAAREAMRAQVLNGLERHGLLDSAGLEACPECGERIIHESLRLSYAKDRSLNARVCAPCGTERAVLDLTLPTCIDLGGEA